MFINSKSITEIHKQRTVNKLRKILWDLICEAEKDRFILFTSPTYQSFTNLGYVLSDFIPKDRFISFMPIEEKILFVMFIYEALPDLI